MSYKEVRDLFEYLKILGYPHHLKLSMLYTSHGCLENFKVIHDILRWLIEQYEPGNILLGGTDTEVDRVLFMRGAVEYFVIKTGIKLNPLRLYASSMVSATELLKVVKLLLKTPMNILSDAQDNKDREIDRIAEIDIDDKMKARQRGKELSSELTNIGATLYDLLGKKDENKERRSQQANRQMEQSNADKILNGVVTSINLKFSGDKGQMETCLAERNVVLSKVERKKADLDRLRQRFETLQKIRPAFSEEFEKAEEELEMLYGQYLTYVRCLDALRDQLNVNAKSAQSYADTTKGSGFNGSEAANSLLMLPDGILDSSDELSNDEEAMKDIETDSKPKRSRLPSSKAAKKAEDKSKLRIKTGVGRIDDKSVVGNMTGANIGSDLDSSLEDLDDDVEDDDETDSELNQVLAAEDDIDALYDVASGVNVRKSARVKLYQSDEDF